MFLFLTIRGKQSKPLSLVGDQPRLVRQFDRLVVSSGHLRIAELPCGHSFLTAAASFPFEAHGSISA
jgi:hypothetical protein